MLWGCYAASTGIATQRQPQSARLRTLSMVCADVWKADAIGSKIHEKFIRGLRVKIENVTLDLHAYSTKC